jgi:hypothetical protein
MVGHREGDFDFCRNLSNIFSYVTDVHFCTMFLDPVAPSGIGLQSIHQPEENLVVWVDFNPDDAFCTLIAACF